MSTNAYIFSNFRDGDNLRYVHWDGDRVGEILKNRYHYKSLLMDLYSQTQGKYISDFKETIPECVIKDDPGFCPRMNGFTAFWDYSDMFLNDEIMKEEREIWFYYAKIQNEKTGLLQWYAFSNKQPTIRKL